MNIIATRIPHSKSTDKEAVARLRCLLLYVTPMLYPVPVLPVLRTHLRNTVATTLWIF
jgi:hypothetical protein